jgi:hypothetical protein
MAIVQPDHAVTIEGKPIVLGRKYRDTLHGIEGIATAHYRFLTGCDRILLEWVKDGEVKNYTVDAPTLIDVETEKPVATDRKRKGGPRAAPTAKTAPT